MQPTDRTPATDGLFMPAEWQPHARCWMQWPCRGDLWRDRLPQAFAAYAAVARAIARFEPVTIVVRPEDESQAWLACGRADNIAFLALAIDDSWARDSGPVFVTDGAGVAGVHWQFNAWGNAYHGYQHDAAVGAEILRHLGMRRYAGPMVLEGGAVSTDGAGTLLVTEECLLNDNRNPELTRQEIEESLALFLGARKVIWLDCGLEDDETDGHVDMVACFAGPARVLLAMPTDRSDPNFARMTDNRDRLKAARDSHGRPIELIEVPLPVRRLTRSDGRRLCASYINYYPANNALIVPGYDDPNDAEAARIIGAACPGREVVQVPALEIAMGGGAIHCITLNQPAGAALGD